MSLDDAQASAHLESTPPATLDIDGVSAWLGHFSRTLKTCRLYEGSNPTVERFRETLAEQLTALLERCGAFTLEFGAHEITCDGERVRVAKERDDNLAMPFYRDGLRTLTFREGLERYELDTLLDVLLRVTRRARQDSEDLVTLLWDADLPHLDMAYVAAETDTDLDDTGELFLGSGVAGDEALVPRRGNEGATRPHGAAGVGDGTAEHDLRADAGPLAAGDDWLAGDTASALDEQFLALEAACDGERGRFLGLAGAERERGLAGGALDLVRDVLHTEPGEAERDDLASLLERVLQEAIGAADWALARETVPTLGECLGGAWNPASVVSELAKPESAATAALVRHLDASPVPEVQDFLAFARSLGPSAAEWLMGIVATAQHQRTRRTLLRGLGELFGGDASRLGPWLADPRWYVVRNAVLVLASTDVEVPPAMFQPVLHHPEPRVRHEVVTVLARSDPDEARPLLLGLVRDPDPAICAAAVHALGRCRNADVASALLALVVDPEFRRRPADEMRTVTAALGSSAGDEVLPALEEQLTSQGWFSKGAGPHCQAIARCVARIGSPEAIEVLRRGARARSAATRDACRLVLRGMGHA